MCFCRINRYLFDPHRKLIRFFQLFDLSQAFIVGFLYNILCGIFIMYKYFYDMIYF